MIRVLHWPLLRGGEKRAVDETGDQAMTLSTTDLISSQMLARRASARSIKRHWPGGIRCVTRPQLAALAVLIAALAAPAAHAKQNVTGVWFDDTGKGAIELYRCGASVCGRIFWLRQAVNKAGKPLRDAYNPSHTQRKRPICGLQVIWGTRPMSDGSWDGGRIYDPKVGKSYDVAIQKIGAKRLRITGYLGAKLFGKSFIWRRAPEDLQKCQVTG